MKQAENLNIGLRPVERMSGLANSNLTLKLTNNPEGAGSTQGQKNKGCKQDKQGGKKQLTRVWLFHI